MRSWWGFPVFLGLVAAAAAVGAFAARDAGSRYAELVQPSWAPPSWLFSPVWTILYVLIAVAGFTVWRRAGVGLAIASWLAQLVLNAAWTPLFFAAGRYGLAFAEIVLLWLLVGATVVLFWRVWRPAALLMVPYWGWVTFAAALNLSIWQLNS
ncbi:tryptophan-rich sensory protein [Solwaraspora sp. WMMA2080]|uniref:TspO/MBR family protein n=1 Tax=unclassified Solwaraspora TaxID=2627926 RepID=UPI00248BA4FA|nr:MULTISPECIES: TspO/MBR family protein [unclassified Solwaraspora]WBB98339.1 tryptophan-rich sensory protein [Solwaraspora sp. WMMA2059]WBC23108.1 tryptophan-rich sensory protein [Solwaraspora sp. WMMA2080]